MAKYESFLTGNFDQILNRIHQEIINGSMSASYEDGSDYRADGIRCAVRVYERYSMLGGKQGQPECHAAAKRRTDLSVWDYLRRQPGCILQAQYGGGRRIFGLSAGDRGNIQEIVWKRKTTVIRSELWSLWT